MNSLLAAGTDPYTIPAGIPPAGVVSNLRNPETRGMSFLIICPIATFIMLWLVGTRLYTKMQVVKEVSFDDLTCAFAALGTLGYFVVIILTLNDRTFRRHIWDVSLGDLMTRKFGILSYLSSWLPNIIRLFAKLTFFLLYLQIFGPNRILRYCIWLGMIVTTLFYVAVSIPQIYWATPKHGDSWFQNIRNGDQHKDIALAVPIAVFNLATDVYILILPIWGILSLQLSRKRKIGLSLIFATGSTAVISSLITLIYKVKIESLDFTWSVFPAAITNYVEMAIGLSAACMPACSNAFLLQLHCLEKLASRLSLIRRRRTHNSVKRQLPYESSTDGTYQESTYTHVSVPRTLEDV